MLAYSWDRHEPCISSLAVTLVADPPNLSVLRKKGLLHFGGGFFFALVPFCYLVRFWHKADLMPAAHNVCFRVQSGRATVRSMSASDPKRTFRA
jgi:hypothetical protein